MGVRGLVIGRFQPLHRGHQALIKAAIEDCVNVVVGIGSTNARQDGRNPFSYEERAEMVRAVFGEQVEVVSLPDIHDPPRWVRHVLAITGPVDKVYGNHDPDLDLFEEEGIAVVRPGLVERERLEGRTLRLKIAEGDPDWRRDVPAPVVHVLERLGADRRLRLLEAKV